MKILIVIYFHVWLNLLKNHDVSIEADECDGRTNLTLEGAFQKSYMEYLVESEEVASQNVELSFREKINYKSYIKAIKILFQSFLKGSP